MRLIEKAESKGFRYTLLQGDAGTDVSALCYDSRKAEAGSLFVCMRGANFDSHEIIGELKEKGVKAVAVDRDCAFPEGITVIRTKDSREALAELSAAWFDFPAEKLLTVGVTGTKGKTTTTHMLKELLEKSGKKTGLIGTNGITVGSVHTPTKNTTPESYLVQQYFAEMVEAGCDSVVMEVSSQALMMDRVAGIVFDFGVITNIEPDHIGPKEHTSFDEYLECKKKLLKMCRIGIVNIDDKRFDRIVEGAACQLETYGYSEQATLRALDAMMLSKPGYLGIRYQAEGLVNIPVEIDIPGKFSVYNSLAAIAVCHHMGATPEAILNALTKAKVKGRVEMVPVSDRFTLMIDYAHNAMALESLLSTLREYHPNRLVCLFGCGGNRDRDRRFEMGEVSGRLADLTIITSDNPRDEEPEAIIADIETGINRTEGQYITIIDRKEAIAWAIHHGEPGDIIILAGKGHEDYQIIKGKKYPMDERVLIQEILHEDWRKGVYHNIPE